MPVQMLLVPELLKHKEIMQTHKLLVLPLQMLKGIMLGLIVLLLVPLKQRERMQMP